MRVPPNVDRACASLHHDTSTSIDLICVAFVLALVGWVLVLDLGHEMMVAFENLAPDEGLDDGEIGRGDTSDCMG